MRTLLQFEPKQSLQHCCWVRRSQTDIVFWVNLAYSECASCIVQKFLHNQSRIGIVCKSIQRLHKTRVLYLSFDPVITTTWMHWPILGEIILRTGIGLQNVITRHTYNSKELLYVLTEPKYPGFVNTVLQIKDKNHENNGIPDPPTNIYSFFFDSTMPYICWTFSLNIFYTTYVFVISCLKNKQSLSLCPVPNVSGIKILPKKLVSVMCTVNRLDNSIWHSIYLVTLNCLFFKCRYVVRGNISCSKFVFAYAIMQ